MECLWQGSHIEESNRIRSVLEIPVRDMALVFPGPFYEPKLTYELNKQPRPSVASLRPAVVAAE
jgi:hypothetical protein